ALRPPLQRHLAWLEQELRQLDGTLRERVQGSPLWREQEDLLRSVPGSGPTTAFTLLAEWPQLGRLDRQALAAFVGVAPLNGASGTLRGRRIVWGAAPGSAAPATWRLWSPAATSQSSARSLSACAPPAHPSSWP